MDDTECAAAPGAATEPGYPHHVCRPTRRRTLDATVDLQAAGLPDITCPVLILWGTRDVILIPRQGRRFERLIPNCELRYLKGLGHVPMSDDPELLREAIIAFAHANRVSEEAVAAEV